LVNAHARFSGAVEMDFEKTIVKLNTYMEPSQIAIPCIRACVQLSC